MKAARRKRRKAGFSPAFLLFISIILRIILSIAQKAKKRKERGGLFLRKKGAGVFRRFFRRIADKMYPWGSIFPKKEVYKKCGRSNALFG